jgi:hypothetical protein
MKPPHRKAPAMRQCIGKKPKATWGTASKSPLQSAALMEFTPIFTRYSIFGIGVDRKHILKWLFPQEKATFHGSKKVYMYSENALKTEMKANEDGMCVQGANPTRHPITMYNLSDFPWGCIC